jgi:hypothetical protein
MTPEWDRIEAVGLAMQTRVNKEMGVLLLFLVLSLGMTWPMAANLGNSVPGWEGDNLFYIRQIWWVKHSLLDLHISPFFNPYAYYPVGYDVASGELTPANTFLFLPITAVWGPVVSYNICLIFSFFASAVGAYLWVWQLTSRRSAALVAGVIFGFLPYRFAHLIGHLELMSTQWLPLTLYALERFFTSRQVRWAAATGVGLSMLALSSWYYAYSALLLLPVYILLRTRPWRDFWLIRKGWLGLGMIVLIGLVLVVPFALPYYRLAAQGQISRTMDELMSWSLNPYDFFIPHSLHPLWGSALKSVFAQQASQPVERTVSLGLVAMGLGMVGLLQSQRAPWAMAILLLWAMSYLIALGPVLHWRDSPVTLPSGSAVPLPTFALYKWMPFTTSARVMTRFSLWTGLMTAALAGWGMSVLVAGLQAKSSRVGYLVVFLLIAAILFESYGMTPDKTTLRPRAVDVWLAQTHPSPVVILELPLTQALRPIQDYYATVHQQATVLGPVGDSFYPSKRSQRVERLRDFPSPASYEAIKSTPWQLSYVLFTPSQIGNWPELHQTIELADVLRYERVVGDVWVYRVQR